MKKKQLRPFSSKIKISSKMQSVFLTIHKDYIADFEKLDPENKGWMLIKRKKINAFINKYRDVIKYTNQVVLEKAEKNPKVPFEHKYVIYAFMESTYKRFKSTNFI